MKNIIMNNSTLFFALVAFVLLTACGGDGKNGAASDYNLLDETARIVSIQVTPADIVVPKGVTGVYTATAYYSDGSSEDITKEALWASANESIVSIASSGDNAGYAEALKSGSTTITATFNNVTSNTAKIKVTNATLQSIRVSPIEKTMAKGVDVKYQAIGIYSDNSHHNLTLFVQWSSSNTNVATINGKFFTAGLAKTLNVGETKIKAIFSNMTSNLATLTVTDAVATSLQISPADEVVPKGTTSAYTAIVHFSDGSSKDVTSQAAWASADSKIVSIITSGENAGHAQALEVGKITITAKYDGLNSNVAKITVTDAVLQSIEVTPVKSTLAKGLHLQYKAIGIYSDNTHKDLTLFSTWKSSDLNVATINNTGLAHAVNVGATEITAQFDSMTSNIAILTVTDAVSTSLQIIQDHVKVPKGTTGRYTAIAFYSDGSSHDVTGVSTWVSADTNIVDIVTSGGSAGFAQALEIGKTTVIAYFDTLTSNISYTEVTAATLQSINISPITKTTPKGISVQYQAIGVYSDSSSINLTHSVSWKSSKLDVSTISKDGLADAFAMGTTTITASFDGITSENATLNVTQASLTSIQVTPADVDVPAGTKDFFTAIGFYSDGASADVTKQATWISDSPEIVSIVTSGSDAGLAHALSAGIAYVTASLDSITSNKAKVTVEGKTIENVQIVPKNETYVAGAKEQYYVHVIYTDLSVKDVTAETQIQSLDTSVATLNSSNVMTAVGIGSSPVGGFGRAELTTTYQGVVSEKAFVFVGEPTLISIQVTPAEVTAPTGTKDRFTAMAYYSDGSSHDVRDQATWISDSPEVVSIVASGINAGLADALTVGTANITASLEGETSSNAVITVTGKIIKNIQITPNNKSFEVGDKEQYQVTVIYEDYTQKDVTEFSQIKSSDFSIATFDENNMMNAIGVGAAELSAVYEGATSEREFLYVTAPTLNSIEVIPHEANIIIGAKGQFRAIAHNSDGTATDITDTATWSSSSSDIVSIDTAGYGEAQSNGTAIIIAELNGVTSDDSNIIVENKTIKNIQISPNNISVNIGDNTIYKVMAVYDDYTQKDITAFSTLVSSDTSVAEFIEPNVATAKSTGRATITATHLGFTSENEYIHVSP